MILQYVSRNIQSQLLKTPLNRFSLFAIVFQRRRTFRKIVQKWFNCAKNNNDIWKKLIFILKYGPIGFLW